MAAEGCHYLYHCKQYFSIYYLRFVWYSSMVILELEDIVASNGDALAGKRCYNNFSCRR